MSRMRLVRVEAPGTAVPATPGSVADSPVPAPTTLLLTASLAEDKQLAVFITSLRTQVVKGALTATGTAHIPGHGSDTFTALVWAVEPADNRVMLTIARGSDLGRPLCLLADVSRLLDHGGGAGRAADYVASLLDQFRSGTGP